MDAAQPWDPFERLEARQRERIAAYEQLLLRFNRKHNLVAAGTEAHLRERHTLHCLALTWKSFPAGSAVVDWGTGGGLPAIPLAIVFPNVRFYAVDAVEKKIQAVRAMARRLRLENVQPWHGRAETWTFPVDYSVSRAAAPLVALWTWHTQGARDAPVDAEATCWRPGLICLKGGALAGEIGNLKAAFPGVQVKTTLLKPLLGGSYFAEKHLVEVWSG